MAGAVGIDPDDTIAAVASPPGAGLRGIVRLSGPRALDVALAGFEPDPGHAADNARRPRRREGRLRLEGLRAAIPAALATWPGRRSYTGQPSAEIHLVGSVPLVARVLSSCLSRGARLAEPGEFTLRAFLSGRIDLTRAEAVLGVIDAASPAQLDAALRQLAGGLAGPVARLRDRLLDLVAHLEADLDFADDEPDVDPLARSALADELADGSADLLALSGQLADRDRPEVAPRVALVGPPNAGKSQLFNALIGLDRALVSPQAGTTRDYLEAQCDCDGLAVDLIDTAGFEPAADDPIAQRAQSHRADQASRADLRLECRSIDDPGGFDLPSGIDRLRVRTKSDLDPTSADPGTVTTSARTGAGLPILRSAIAASLRSQAADGDAVAGTGARCREALERAAQALGTASQTMIAGGGDELVAVDLHQALDDLGAVVGATVADDILDRIFRRFCIGK